MDFIFDPSLVLYLPLYQLDGASFTSKDAYGHLCTVTGALWRPNGRYFDGSDDKIALPTILASETVMFNSGLTLLAWIKASSENHDRGIFGQTFSTAYTYNSDGGLYIKANNKAGFVAYEYDVAYRWANGTTVVDDDNFHLIGGVFKRNNQLAVYVDGKVEGGWGYPITNLAGANQAEIGWGQKIGTDNWFKGLIGEVWAFIRELTPLEIQNVYLATKWRYQ